MDSFNKLPESLRLEEHIELSHLQELMELFNSHRPETRIIESTSKYAPTKYEHREPGALNPQEFKDTIAGVLCTRKYDDQLDKLFTKLDTSADGFVDWNEFVTYMLLHYRENDYVRTKKEIPFMHEAKIKHILHNKQECTVRIIALDNPLRYVTVSKEGAICIWSSALTLEKMTYTDPEMEDLSGSKRKFKMWITDAAYLSNCHKIAIASTRRDIRFYDIAGNQMIEDYQLYGLTNIPHCLSYHYNVKDPNGAAMLLWGDEHSDMHILRFKSPVTQLFEKAFTNQKQAKNAIYMQELWKHERFVEHSVINGLHPSEPIKRISYISDNDRIICGSSSPKYSVVVIDRKCDKKPYIFKINKGVNCFDLSKQLNLLVTGSADHVVRLWNPYVCVKPITVLEGHYSAILDVMIYEILEQVFSYSSDAILKVWDIKDYTCLQTIQLKFPTSMYGHIPDHGSFPMHLQAMAGSANNSLIIASNDYIGRLKLGLYEKPSDDIPKSHNAPLCAAIYNEFFREVVTGADDSTLVCWDFETGNKNLVFTDAHGDEEITCMAFDGNWRRLITGARNGTIKVWNFQNGHNLHKLQPVDETEITGVLSLVDKETILTFGWNRRITKYDDSEGDNLYIPYDDSWKGGIQHKDDIIDMAYCAPYLIATGSFDAEILVWTLETEKVILRLDATGGNKVLRKTNSLSKGEGSTSRPNSRHRNSHHLQEGIASPIDKLLFLKHRIDSKMTEAAVLLSSQSGIIKFWSIFGTKHLLGEFRGTDFTTESVLAMSCNKTSDILVTGDTLGYIYTWNISTHCIRPQNEVLKEKPILCNSWRGHDLAIVSIEYVEHKCGNFLLTASSDHSARLFTDDGKCVGTFGQSIEWNVADINTWIYPLSPVSIEYLQSFAKKSNNPDLVNDDAANQKKAPECTHDNHKKSSQKDSKNTVTIFDEVEIIEGEKRRLPKVPSISSPNGIFKVDSDTKIEESAKTFNLFAQKLPKTSLGLRAANELLKSRINRQQRRFTYGHVDKEDLTQGKSCCPFQVLATAELNDNILPKQLPVTNRMIQRGYTAGTLNESTLKAMDLSLALESDEHELKKKPRKTKSILPSISTKTNLLLGTKP